MPVNKPAIGSVWKWAPFYINGTTRTEHDRLKVLSFSNYSDGSWFAHMQEPRNNRASSYTGTFFYDFFQPAEIGEMCAETVTTYIIGKRRTAC